MDCENVIAGKIRFPIKYKSQQYSEERKTNLKKSKMNEMIDTRM